MNKKIISFFITFFLLNFNSSVLFAQHLVNNGNGIVINEGAWLMIGGNFINQNSGQDGFVDIDGKMVVNRDFINNAGNETFINIEAAPQGEVILNGGLTQNISGISPTAFEHLTIKNSRKILQTDFCNVNGRLSVQAILEMNAKTLVINNSAQNAITYQSGYILCETPPVAGLGIILWNIKNQSGFFQIPFGSGNHTGNDLNLSLDIISTGSNEGYFSFSTYPTNSLNNPFPPSIFSIEPFEPEQTTDRFWLVSPSYISKPSASIEFTYDYASVSGINRNVLKAIRFNSNVFVWNDWGPAGHANAAVFLVVTPIIQPADFFSWWTLTAEAPEEFIYFPNAFTPNNDGLNEDFKPFISGFEPKEYILLIFDRWGKQIFQSNDINKGWDGRINETICKQDVYVWYVIYQDLKNNTKTKNGIVTLIK